MSIRFARYELRTTNVEGARTFYEDVLGGDFWQPRLQISQLPEQALSRGAKPHWLGRCGVRDVEGTVAHLLEKGAERLGPPASTILRDPFGALVSFEPGGVADDPEDPVIWRSLHTRDLAKAGDLYSSLFGWTLGDVFDLGAGETGGQGTHRRFSWDKGGTTVGSISDAALNPSIHPQWLYFFPASDLEGARRRVIELGGIALPPTTTGTGAIACACDDPQSAAFGLFQPAS